MASSLEDTIPQWKKDLILRKRAANSVTSGGVGTGGDHDRAATPVSSLSTVRQERCDSAANTVSDKHVKMVQDSVLVMRIFATNGNCCPNSDSDSSEELQYGPGIVSKLKSKYLSLTLREAHNQTPRPSILPLRRAASLEQLLDAEDVPKPQNRRFTPRIPAAGAITAPSPRYRAQTRRNGTEAVKRARSVETISRNSHLQEEPLNSAPFKTAPLNTAPPNSAPLNTALPGARKPCRPLRITPVLDQAERPPADHVKQTLRLFEGPAVKRTRPPPPTGEVATRVATFKHIIQQNKPPQCVPPAPPLPLSPKPTVLPPKPINIPPSSPVRVSSPVKISSPVKVSSPVVISPPPVMIIPPMKVNPVKVSSKGKIPPPAPPRSPSSLKMAPTESPIPDVLDAAGGLCPTPDLIVHSSPQTRPFSPHTLQDITETFLKCEVTHSSPSPSAVTSPPPIIRPKSPTIETKPSRSPSPRVPPPDPPQSPSLKEIDKQAVDNISMAGHTITYRFSDALSSPKSHLPRLNSVPVRIKLVPDTTMSSPPLKMPSTVVNTPPIPIPTAKIPQVNVVNGRPKSQPPKAPLTSREIEKNSINKLKTLEQPVSKVVVAMRSVDEVVAKKAKPRVPQHQETTILFNFSARESIPDYIASDGSQSTRRGKREKPKPGESGIILLPGAPAEEFADDDEDWMLSLNGPPSPCDVHFVNDNILIDGKSSISKQPKRQKLRIQFDDDATQVFEYLSEASALEDTSASSTPVTSPPPVAGHTVPSLTGSSLASYTPSKMSVTADFQLGVTRQPVVTHPPAASAPDSLDLLAIEHPVTYSAETTADILF